MENLERDVVIAELVEKLREHGSWCGETHVQKAMYFVQDLTDVPSGFEFILYKHGPFSFDLRDEITAMRADLLLELEVRSPNYGPSLKTTETARRWCRRHQDSVNRARPAVEFVAAHFGERNVADLERLGTALYVLRKLGDARDPGELARHIVELKPHVELSQAREAVETVLEWQAEAERLGLRAA
jgi:hypothetical protein